MKVLRGKENIGFYKDIRLMVDWKYITHDNGIRKEENDIQLLLGSLLRATSLIYIIGMVVYEIYLGNNFFIDIFNVDTPLKLVYWFSVILFLYSLYYKRDRKLFLDSFEHKEFEHLKKLVEHKKIKEIDIADYIDYDVLYFLDDVLKKDKYFLQELLHGLYDFKSVRTVMNRVDLSQDKWVQVIKEASKDINTSRDSNIRQILKGSFDLAYSHNFKLLDEVAIFLYCSKYILNKYLIKYNILEDEIDGLIMWMENISKRENFRKIWREKASLKPKNTVDRAYTSVLAKTLEMFKTDYVKKAIDGKFDYSISREGVISEVLRLLHQGEKGAVMMVGETGVGKSTLIQSIALLMVLEEVPVEIRDKRLIGFNFNKAFAISGSIDKFKMIVEKVMREVSEAGNIILVMDDFENLINIREEASAEIISLVSEAIDKTDLRVIATTTNEGYDSIIKPQKAVSNLFDLVPVEPVNEQVAFQILLDETPKIERKYGVSVTIDAIRSIIKLSDKYAFDRVLPEKGIDLLEEVCVYCKDKNIFNVTDKEVGIIVSKKVGVKVGLVSDEEQEKLLRLEEEFHKRVIGQEQAVKAVSNALRRARAGLNNSNKPIASFLFFGPTGVGKTEVAKTLTRVYYGTDDLMIRLDMSEFQEEENLKRLIGYKDGNEFLGGRLTESVRNKPFSLVLLDEIEKANPKILDLFLQILDEGTITDGIGRKVSFENTIIIATSNVGSKTISKKLRDGLNYQKTKSFADEELRNQFRIEFLNRFDDVIMFRPLREDEVIEIAKIFLSKIDENLNSRGMDIEYTKGLLRDLVKLGYNKEYGARELSRVIQTEVNDRIAKMILNKKLTTGKKLLIHDLEHFVIE